MDSIIPLKKMKRSKSLNSLELGEEWNKSGTSDIDDSGVQADGFVSLERKVDALNDMCKEQTRVLAELTRLVRAGAAHASDQLASEMLQRMAEESEKTGESGAKSLLSAIEAKPSLERRVGDALTELLQSEDLKQRIVCSTTASIREMIKNLFSVEVSSLHVPIMERAHRQLLRHVTRLVANAFAELEETTAACNAQVQRQTSLSLQEALKRHQQALLQTAGDNSRLLDAVACTAEKVIERELKQWREEMSTLLPRAVSECDSGQLESPGPMSECASPDVSPSDSNNGTGLSPVDRMMITAEVNKLIKEGEINEAFKKALLAMDLSVVVATCRAAAPALAEVALAQPVLLSLLQQLATDLLLDTQVKCSFIEYALLNINPLDPVTRAHLPLVAEELRRHLGSFLAKYPHHAEARRIAAIVDTARSFL